MGPGGWVGGWGAGFRQHACEVGMPRAVEASAPLLSGDVNGSVAVGGGGQQMATPSSLDDTKCCRICLESTDSEDPFAAGRLIAPCQCRGTSAWVHRGCLDRWRATQEDRAFSQCTECRFSYEYVQTATDDEDKGWLFDDGPLTAKRRRAAKFHMFVARDFLGVFLVLQFCIFLIAGFVRKADCGTWSACAPGNSTNSRDCCADGYLVNNIFPLTLMQEHTQSAYYLVGLVLFFAGIGLVGVCNKRVLPQEQQCCSDTGGCNCCSGYNNYWCWYSYQPAPVPDSCDCCCCSCNNSGSTRHHHQSGGHNSSSTNCNGCNCGGSGGGGGGGAQLAG